MADDTAVPSAPPAGDPAAPASPLPAVEPSGGALKAERDAEKVYRQEEVDKIAAAVKKNALSRARAEAKAYYEGRLSAQPVAPSAPAPEAKPPAEEAPPARDKFDSYEAYLEAKAEFTGRKAAENYRQRVEKEQAEAKARTEAETRSNSFREKLVAKYPDISERAADIAHITLPSHVVEAMQESDFGPDILNSFIDNPKELERITALSQSAALREIGRMEARLEAASPAKEAEPAAPAAAKPSRAPTPLRPVGGTAVEIDGEPSHDKPDEWRVWRERQIQKRRASPAVKTA